MHHANPDRSSSPSPPSRANLKAWWRSFKAAQKAKRAMSQPPEPTSSWRPAPGMVFGVPLRDSLRYANVPISTASGKDGMLYIYGYVPVVVAKCGLYLKETATEVEGTFRVSGSAKRMRELQTEFETPPKYGKHIDWRKSIYTTHDVASVFRRYLTQMPEPVIPHSLYHKFRDAYSQQPFNHDRVVTAFQGFIRSMPRSNQYLLLYVLDLLSVFARKSDKNLMTTTNLAVIFRPAILSHPDQELSPQQHKLSQEILEFLIDQQDRFLLDVPPPPRNDSILVPSPAARLQGATGLGSPIPAPDDDYFMVPSSGEDEEQAGPSGSGSRRGGWKLVENRQQPTDRPRFTSNANSSDIVLGEAMNNGAGASVKRSVTVPSRKSPGPELPSGVPSTGSGATASSSSANKLHRRPRGARDMTGRSGSPGPGADIRRSATHGSRRSHTTAAPATGVQA